MLPRLLARRLGPFGLALTAYDIWRRIPPRQRAQIVAHARRQASAVRERRRSAGRKP